MRSFAIWYKEKEDSKREHENSTEEKAKAKTGRLRETIIKEIIKELNLNTNNPENTNVAVDVHVNLIESANKNKWYIDFGIKVQDISNVEIIYLFCPFPIKDVEEIADLTDVMDTKLLKALFNENLTVVEGIAKRRLVKFSNDENPQVVVYRLDTTNEISLKHINEHEKCGTIVAIDTKDILKPIHESTEDVCKNYYFRFRIGIPDTGAEIINHEIEGISIASCKFTKTEIIDFRLNNIRSIGDNAQDEINKGEFFYLKSVHLLILKNAKDVLMYPSENPSTRMLEAELWQQYLRGNKDNDKEIEDLVAYHFKKKSTSRDNNISEYNVLARFSSTTIPKYAIFWFIVFAIFLELACNALYDYLK